MEAKLARLQKMKEEAKKARDGNKKTEAKEKEKDAEMKAAMAEFGV